MRRFTAWGKIIYRRFKITEEDCQKAVDDIVARTSINKLPWLLAKANDKYYARIKIIKAYCERRDKMLDESWRSERRPYF